jgi:hypothetical protein
MGIKRLIDNQRIATIAPTAQHGGGDVARPGPHRQAQFEGLHSALMLIAQVVGSGGKNHQNAGIGS